MMDYFQGARYQRGSGLGSILSGLVRSAVPMVMPGLKAVGKEVLKGGLNVLGDVVQGRDSIKQATKRRFVEGATNLLRPPPPRRRRRTIKRAHVKGRRSDIFQ